jgi:hypothetical protein
MGSVGPTIVGERTGLEASLRGAGAFDRVSRGDTVACSVLKPHRGLVTSTYPGTKQGQY